MKKTSIILLLLLASCTKTVYVPKETKVTEYRDRVLVDSVYRHDSVYFAVKGDTVYLEKYRYIYKDKIVRDSVFIRDSVSYPVYVKGDTEYVKHIPKFFWWCFWIALAVIGWGAVKLIARFKAG